MARKVNPGCPFALASPETSSTYSPQSNEATRERTDISPHAALGTSSEQQLLFCQKEVEIEINVSILRWKKGPFLHHVPFEKPHSLEAKFIVSFCDSLLFFSLKTWYLRVVIEFRFSNVLFPLCMSLK